YLLVQRPENQRLLLRPEPCARRHVFIFHKTPTDLLRMLGVKIEVSGHGGRDAQARSRGELIAENVTGVLRPRRIDNLPACVTAEAKLLIPDFHPAAETRA